MTITVKRLIVIQYDRPAIEFNITLNVIESLNFAKFHGFYDVSLSSIPGRSADYMQRCGF